MNTTSEKEASRYDWVIHLDTAAAPDYDTTNEVRNESFQEALDLNEKIKASWAIHPQRIIITSSQDFFSNFTAKLLNDFR